MQPNGLVQKGISLPVRIEGALPKVILDTGTTVSFVSVNYAKQNNLPMKHSHTSVTLADERSQLI